MASLLLCRRLGALDLPAHRPAAAVILSGGLLASRCLGYLGCKLHAVRQVAGVDLEGLIRQTQAGWTREQPVADFEAGNERVQIFLDGLGP